MSGHNRASDLGQQQKGVSLDGRFLEFNAGVPANGTSGFGKGALAVDSSNGKLYINQGTSSSATWSEVSGSGGQSHVYSQPGVAESVATLLKSGKANLSVVGDSISNHGATTFDTFHKGVIEHFKPDTWRGVFFEPLGGFPNTFFNHLAASNTGTPGTAGYFFRDLIYCNDGAMSTYSSALEGEFCSTAYLIAYDDARTTGSSISRWEVKQELFNNSALPTTLINFLRDKSFENSAGTIDFVDNTKFGTADTPRFGAVFLTSDSAEAGFEFYSDLRLRAYTNDTANDVGGGYVNKSLTISGISEELVFLDTDFTASGTYNVGNNFRLMTFPQSAGIGGNDRLLCHVAGFIGYSDADRPTGLRMSCISQGGADTSNFLLEPGDPDINSASGIPWAFTDAALQRRLAVMETNVVMIHLGTNNSEVKSSNTGNYDPATYVVNLFLIIQRFRDAASAAGIDPLKFIIVGQMNQPYNGAPGFDSSNIEAQYENYSAINSLIIQQTKGVSDVVYFDTYGYLQDTAYNHDGYATGITSFASNCLDDGTHPNPLGVEVVIGGLWNKLAALAS